MTKSKKEQSYGEIFLNVIAFLGLFLVPIGLSLAIFELEIGMQLTKLGLLWFFSALIIYGILYYRGEKKHD